MKKTFSIQRRERDSFVPSPGKMRLKLESEGYSVFQWKDNPKASYAPHKHSADQTHWIISGALEITIENSGTYVLEAGDRDFLPAETYHSARVTGEEPVVYLIGEKLE